MRWPGERDVDDRERRHRALVGQFDELVELLAGRRIGLARREVHLPVLARCARRAACPPRAPAGTRSREAKRCAGSRCCSATTCIVTGSRSSAALADVLGLVAEREVGDVGDRADRLVDPVRVHPRAGADRVGGAGVDRVQQRGVGAVELDQRPRERAVQRLALQRLPAARSTTPRCRRWPPVRSRSIARR